MQSDREDRSDEYLMAAFARGDDSAFDRLAERWWRPLVSYFRRKGLLCDDAEDLAQWTLVKLFSTRRKGTWHPGHLLRPYLFTIAQRVGIEHFRNQRREKALNEAMVRDAAKVDLPRGLKERLHWAIRCLPEPEQTCILVCGKHGVGDLEHNDIARMMGRSAPRIAELCQRGRSLLREMLESAEG